MDIPHVETSATDYAGLLKQRRELDEKLAAIRAEAIEQFKQRILAEAQELEVDLIALLMPARKPRTSLSETGKVRFRNPDNPAETWSGRGRPPAWMQALLDGGADKQEFSERN